MKKPSLKTFTGEHLSVSTPAILTFMIYALICQSDCTVGVHMIMKLVCFPQFKDLT